MKPLPSIRQRLSYALFGISIVWGLAVTGAVGLAVQHEVDELLDDTLQESAEILYGLLSFNAAQLPLTGGGAMPAPVHDEHIVWQIVSASHQVQLRSHRAPDLVLVDQPAMGLSSNGEAWRVYGMPFDQSGRILYVAQRGQDRSKTSLEATAVGAGAALVVGLLCVIWMRFRVREELAPITAMSAAVTQFNPLNPSRPGQSAGLDAATRSELLPMQDAINDLGARLARRMANERAFSSHAAHALRTPLAGMVAQLAVAQRKSPPEAQAHLLRTRQAAKRLQQVVTALLTLFRSGAEVKWLSVAVADLLTPLQFDKLTLTTHPSARIKGDPDLISAALMNLLENALRHGASQVTVNVIPGPNEMGGDVLVVQDDGSGIPEGMRQRLQQALDSQDYDEQMGLGLMLADLVARAHGGLLYLCPSATGCKLELRLGAVASGADQSA